MFGGGLFRQAAWSSAGNRYPVTARHRSSHLRAAASTSSALTFSMRSGHSWTSRMVWPVASAAPYQRARVA